MTRTHRICVLPGDGIGPEVTAVALRVLAEAGAAHGFALEVDEQLFGVIAVLEAGPVTPDLGGRPPRRDGQRRQDVTRIRRDGPATADDWSTGP